MHVAIIGCGVVGAAIAYELSRVSGLQVTLIDQQTPASGSTGAALGVLMGAISHKTKGRAWRLRQESLERYETLIPELEALTGQQIPFNRQGILMLYFAIEERKRWEKLTDVRRSQGWQLEIWEREQVFRHCPQLEREKIAGAVYSPNDRQVHPAVLTKALVTGAQRNGVRCLFGKKVEKFASTPLESELSCCKQVFTADDKLDVDWVVVAAGLGSTALASSLQQTSDIRPVLGQALHLRLNRICGNSDFQPVITADDVHLVPVSATEYWIGATVEFPGEEEAIAQPALLESVRQQAISLCPALADAAVVRTWSGLRPRPEGQPAPLIGQLSGYSNVLLATGHYRNGVLLATATAKAIREAILDA